MRRMSPKTQTIEVDEATAEVLEARAAARGMSVSELLADQAGAGEALPTDLQTLRDTSDGPWAPDVLAEDARRLAEFQRTREAVPLGGREGVAADLGNAERAVP
jgi:Ribbon-helix-helix protein, copG family